jgi:hypothetical protein
VVTRYGGGTARQPLPAAGPAPPPRTWRSRPVDPSLPVTGTITGTVTLPAGTIPGSATIYAVDAITGDYAGPYATVHDDGTFTLTGPNTQHVWLYYGAGGHPLQRYPTRLATTVGGTISGIRLVVSG